MQALTVKFLIFRPEVSFTGVKLLLVLISGHAFPLFVILTILCVRQTWYSYTPFKAFYEIFNKSKIRESEGFFMLIFEFTIALIHHSRQEQDNIWEKYHYYT